MSVPPIPANDLVEIFDRDPDEAYRDAVLAEIGEWLPYALCWFFGALLAVLVPALVYMELAS
jgi:hypothetical protein